jgi:hypothetical protein
LPNPDPVLVSPSKSGKPGANSTALWRDSRLLGWILLGITGGAAAVFFVLALTRDGWQHEVAIGNLTDEMSEAAKVTIVAENTRLQRLSGEGHRH